MRRNMKGKCFLMTICTTILLVVLVFKSEYHLEAHYSMKFVQEFREFSRNWRNLSKDQMDRLSTLGRILYLDEIPPLISQSTNHTYQILVWKYGPMIENRHIKQYSSKRTDPFEECPVQNCNITYEDTAIDTADIVIIHLQRTKGLSDLPQVKHRNPQQLWAFLTDESPYNTFLSPNIKLTDFNSIFNWSMTYRMDSDIPVPYGRMIERIEDNEDIMPKNKRRDVLIAIMGSNCGGRNKRWDYIKELQKHIKVHVYGSCGNLKCPGHFRVDCQTIDQYMFYLAFENSNCNEYISEKLWWNAYTKDAIPIVMGANRDNYTKLLPPNSYLNTDDFAKPSDLAGFILYLNQSSEYKYYYAWKRKYRILQEHGYFGSKSYHYCRVCQALNYNSRQTKIYKHLDQFWNIEKNCRPAWNKS